MIYLIGSFFISLAIYFGLRGIANAIRNPHPKSKVSRNAIGLPKMAEIVKKEDILDEIIKQ